MFSPSLPLSANDEANETVNRSWSQPPTLTISEFDQNRFEEQLFSPTSPVSAELDQNRIEELLFPSTSPASAQPQSNQVEELPFSPPSSANEAMPPPHRRFHIPQPLPRYFDELHTERSYLLDCLQIENRKATELLRSISPLEERLIQKEGSSFERRKAKKQLGWLRHRLDETSRQEKSILARLGQVTFEIQKRERWAQIEFERRQCEVERYTRLYCMQQMPLNPESPIFQPLGYQMPCTPWPPENWQQWQSRDGQEGCEGNYRPSTESCSSQSKLATECSPSDEISPDDIMTTTGPSLDSSECRKCSLMHRSSSLNDAVEQLEAFSTNTTTTSVAKVKRLSLPSFPIPLIPGTNIWALTPEEKDGDIQEFFRDGDQVEGS